MFSIKESLKYGWQKSKEHLELVLFTTLLTLGVGFFVGDKKYGFFNFLLMIFLLIIRIGYTKIFLRIYDGESPKFVEIFQEYRTFWRYLGTSILTCLTILGGFILLIIPGIFWAVRFSFAPIIVVDTKSGPVISMKESWAITKGKFWKILLFWLTIIGFNMLGVLALGIGLLVTIPVSNFASIYVYRELTKTKAGLISTPSPQTS